MGIALLLARGREKRIEKLEGVEGGRVDYDAWSRTVSAFAALPVKRGLWTMADVAYTNPQVIDASNQANHLNNTNVSTFGFTGLIPHVTFNGTTQYLSANDGGAGGPFDILGTEGYTDGAVRGLTLGGYFLIGAFSAGDGLMSKDDAATIAGSSYNIQVNGVDFVAFRIFGGGATSSINSATITASAWTYIVGRFTPGIPQIDICTNGVFSVPVATAIAALNDTPAPFNIGSRNNNAAYTLPGRASMCFLCAAALSNATILALFEQSRAMFGV